MERFKLGLLDPMWEYDNKQQNDPKRGGIQYPTMSMKELAELPMGNAFDTDSTIVVWATFPKLMDFYYEQYNPVTVIRSWGFRPVTALFVWIKLNRNSRVYNGAIKLTDLYSGLGRYTNSNAEIAIVARKGKGIPRVQKNVKQIIVAPIRAHSEKPQEQYDRLDALYGNVRRVEIFARKQNPPPIGWEATGYDYDGMDIRDWLTQFGRDI